MIKKLFYSFLFLVLTGIYIYSFGNLTIAQSDLGKEAFFITTNSYKGIRVQNADYNELLRGEKLKGIFIADNNFLGQVSIRFYNFQRINPDSIIFRIKEKGQNKWYYENTYKTDQFQPNMLFPFGFSIIANSKGKIYNFEIESLNGLSEHAIGLSTVKPLGIVLYQYPRLTLFSNPKTLLTFIVDNKIKKIKINTQTFVEVGKYFDFIILSSFLIFLSWRYLKKIKIGSFSDINSSYIVVVGIILLTISGIIYSFKKIDLSYLISTLAYFVLVLGVIYAIFEVKKNSK
jgi:hypothetical protein